MPLFACQAVPLSGLPASLHDPQSTVLQKASHTVSNSSKVRINTRVYQGLYVVRSIPDEDQAHLKNNAKKYSKHTQKNQQTKPNQDKKNPTTPIHLTKRQH